MSETVQPIFLYSMPRSGSTLLQRILGSHRDIATVSEPHVMLALISTYSDARVYDDAVMHAGIQAAISDMIAEMPNGQEDFRVALRRFVLEIYTKVSCGKPYFVDKTPLYAVIAPQLYDLFPEAKHIVLWRNPLAILPSIARTFEANAWTLTPWHLHLFCGMERMIEVSQKPGVFCLQYETLLTAPEATLRGLFDYLELEFSEDLITNFPQLTLNGANGDPTGVKEYRALSQEPLRKWESAVWNPYRKHWTRRYLKWLGEERLAHMGYSLHALQSQLDDTRSRPGSLFRDLVMNLYRRLQFLVWPHLAQPTRQKIKAFLNSRASRSAST